MTDAPTLTAERPGKLTLAEWVKERLDNCQRIAAQKTGADRDGWLEDGAYFAAILPYVSALNAPGREEAPSRDVVMRAAHKWCGQKNRETSADDVRYFEANWSSLPGLKAFVDVEMTPPTPNRDKLREDVERIVVRYLDLVNPNDVVDEFLALLPDRGGAVLPSGADGDYVDIVFDGPPSQESSRFVEVENAHGLSISFGEWVHRTDGYWALRIAAVPTDPNALVDLKERLRWQARNDVHHDQQPLRNLCTEAANAIARLEGDLAASRQEQMDARGGC